MTAHAAFEDVRRQDILRTARRKFTHEGYGATGMEAIARDASVSTATLYQFFASKADLFQAVIEDAALEFEERMNAVQALDGDAGARITHFARLYGRFMGDPFVLSIFRLVVAERPRFDGMAAHYYERGRARIGSALVRAIKELEASGQLKTPKPSWAAGQLLGMIEHPLFFVPLVVGEGGRSTRAVEDICDEAAETFLARYATPQG
ncbi:TetR/AcrR family transcriptional regulator [Brevundimonas sp. 2R-24]|uniref:TetR/AcrR family transcriptional regulator n=1 Tax=Peiella sedimenti TaxID=3061083 RepID=A0ABT8SPV8_9CAUL|nr:TetR/AcrR family transcriptional regulator [Caulobacteraceae bacterium XZ-24]